MQRNDRWPEDYEPDGTKSRPSSRRNSSSTSLSRRSSGKKEKEKEKDKKKSPPGSAGGSSSGTPKKKPQNLEFVVTGKQCLKKYDRANSVPGYRRPSADSKGKKLFEAPRRGTIAPNNSQSSRSRETSLEDDMSLDLSQVSDFEDTNSKYGIKSKFVALATSTPKIKSKPRSGSLQSHLARDRKQQQLDSRDTTFSCSRDSIYKTSASSSASAYNKYGMSTELDYSSVSPEYSGQSSTEVSPRVGLDAPVDPNLSSCTGSSWQDCSDAERTAVAPGRADGEWSQFWANYNNSLARVPVKNYYDQCPTPYRTENIDLADLEFSANGSKHSPDNLDEINYVIRNEGLHLTPRETQNMIKCAHILGNVLSKAIERRCREREGEERVQEVVMDEAEREEDKEEDPEIEMKKKTLTLDLKDTNEPEQADRRVETATTQTDISLPNTKSAPRIFEKILRQLSKSSLDEGLKALELKAMENKEVEIEVKKDENDKKDN